MRSRAACSTIVLIALAMPRIALTQANVMGQWTALFPVTEQATQCAVLHGQGDTTVVLYWDRSNTARVWIWNPADPTHSPQAAAPSSGPLQEEGCATMLPDGRMLLSGGYGAGGVGVTLVSTFDPKHYWDSSTHGWAPDDPMVFHRGSPNGTPLADGTILVQSGVDHFSMPMFGGDAGAGALADLRELATGNTFRWPARPNPAPPAPRIGASLVFAFTQLALFGGRDAGGPRNDLWLLQRRQEDNGVRWIWSPTLLVAGSPTPPARSEHGAVVQSSFCDSLCDTLWVYGGLGAGGNALGDVWRLVYGSKIQNRYRWENVTTAGDGPGRRYGHTCVVDAGPPGGEAAGYPRMLVFGGRDSTGALCDNSVWSMTLRSPFRWSRLTTPGGAPAPRTNQVATFDNRSRFPVTKPKRMIVFGGEGAAGTLSDTWFLFRNHGGPADTTYAWTQNAASPTSPPARSRAAFAYDVSGDRVLVWGGDADGGDVTSGLLGDLWALGPSLDPAYPAIWTAFAADSSPAPRAGAAMQWWPRGSVTVMTPERFDPAAAPGTRWASLDWAPKYDQYLYPYMLLTRQGRVLYAGVTDSCAFLDPDPLSPTRGWGPRFTALFSGASCAEVRPDLFMKSGGDQQPTLTGLLQLDANGNTTGWQGVSGMLPRVDHSTITLPGGRVLVTGGDAIRKNTALAQRQPQVFDPIARTWSAPLAPDPAIRGYHSTAVLLPDARVLSWGGFIGNTPKDSAEIYSPPYLFSDAAGTLAARPEITAVQDTIAWGQTFTLCTCQATNLASMALIRPGSPTHAFDQNARYVPLSFQRDPSGTFYAVAAPPDGGAAPPGDYMLFVVDTAGVPSVARWVRVRGGAAVASVSCPSPCVTAVDPGPRLEFALLPARPNPSFAATTLAFQLPAATRVTLDVLDLQGRLVRRLADRRFEAGRHLVPWDGGRAEDGHRASPGVYFARLRAEDGREQRVKLVRLP